MSWHPNDLVTDQDLRDYEQDILKHFGQQSWLAKRTKALEDWLYPILRTAGYDPYTLQTRAEADLVWGYTGSVYTDLTSAARNTTQDDLNLASVFTAFASDVLYVGSTQLFRGLNVRVTDAVGSAASVLTVSYWAGGWVPFLVSDGTVKSAGKTFSGGGAVSWLLPSDWEKRTINNSEALYWVKVSVSATPTGAKAQQVGCIRNSQLRAPATFRTLQLIFAEAPTTADSGPWAAKAEFYGREADASLQRALPLLGSEFDTDDSGQLSEEETEQTAEEAGSGPFTLERA